uniref:Small ribosomal subunit protein bS18c n=1 Tax=Aphanochaete confervicola TaxID=764104 RepID=A0A6H1XEF0_9CHLO|nr:ribosomal protein S18 [Aphanochaete confervicola]QJA13898.1 ribosomal protein S18 [Aphanochaete confervicola]
MGTSSNKKLIKIVVPKRKKYKNLELKKKEALKTFSFKKQERRGKKFSKQKKENSLTLPVIPPKSVLIILKSRNKKIYDRKLIDYKNRGLLQEYINFAGKIIPKRKTGITTKQQRYLTKAIKTARILGLLPFVKKEKGFFR